MGHRHLGITVVPFQHIDEVSPNPILPHLVGIKVSFVGEPPHMQDISN